MRLKFYLAGVCFFVLLSACGAIDAMWADIPDFEQFTCKENQRVNERYACEDCPRGTTRPAGDLTGVEVTKCTPILCKENQRVEANVCVACLKGSSRPAGGDASGADTQCNVDTCGSNQRVVSNECVPCKAGEVNVAGDDPTGSDTVCDGSLCSANQRVQSNMCVACRPGTTNQESDDPRGADTACEPIFCLLNQRVASNQCVPCAVGTTNSAGDDASGVDTMCESVVCEIDHYVQMNRCIECPAGQTRPAGDLASGPDTMCDFTRVTKASAGWSHTCAITSDRGVMCWGDNSEGKLGAGVVIERSNVPLSVKGLPDEITQISAGQWHTCAVSKAQDVYCWGDNSEAQLGDARKGESRSVAIKAKGIAQVKEISVGGKITCAISTSEELWCWGADTGSVINTDTEPQLSGGYPNPVKSNLVGVKSVSLKGEEHICALTQMGLYCWGKNDEGQLGIGTTTFSSSPVLVDVGGAVDQVCTGRAHTCVLLLNGKMKCWGSGNLGQLGTGSFSDNAVPVEVKTSKPFAKMTCGGDYTCGLHNDGELKCWGNGAQGQLGTGGMFNINKPEKPIDVGFSSSTVVSGREHTCALSLGGSMSCWGQGSMGQLGNGMNTTSLAPSRVKIE